MEWTNTNVNQLIELYREHEVLWNTALSDYKNRNKKHEAWTRIAKYFQTDKDKVEKKMRSLIGQFQREQKKLTSRVGTDGVSESKWFAYKRLTFLNDKHKPRLSQEVGIKSQTMDPSDFKVEINLTQQYDQVKKDPDISLEIQSNVDADGPKELFQFPQKTSNSTTKRFKIDNTSMVDEPYHVTKSLYQKNEDKDEFDNFGQHIACKIRKLSTSYAKNTVQNLITNLIYQAELGQYDQPSQSVTYIHQTPYFNHQLNPCQSVSASNSSQLPIPITSYLQQPSEDYKIIHEA